METSIIKLPLDNPAYLQYRSHCRGISYLNISSQEFVLVKIADMLQQQMKLLSTKHVGNHQTAMYFNNAFIKLCEVGALQAGTVVLWNI